MPSLPPVAVRDLGLLIHLPAVLAVPSMLVALLAGEAFALPGLAVTAVVSLALGQFLYRRGEAREDGHQGPALAVAALAWLLIAIIGSLPFLLAAFLQSDASNTTQAFRNPLNALFESMSGFTSTGLTVAADPAELPRTLQWWRSLSQWVGAIGVIVFALAFLHLDEGDFRLYAAEARRSEFMGDLHRTVTWIWLIYAFFTTATVATYLLLGMPAWEALNHGLAGIATGGFTITSDSFAGYGAAIKLVTLMVIVVGALPFQGHHALLTRGDWRVLARQSQVRTFALLLVLGIVLLPWSLRASGEAAAAVDVWFQWLTALGTCGFSTVTMANWSAGPLLLLAVGMTLGATTGSTVGGFKLHRVAWLAKGLLWGVRAAGSGGRARIRYDGRPREPDEARQKIGHSARLAALWLAMLVAGFTALSLLPDHSFAPHHLLFEAASALGNVGLSTGISSPDLHPVGRITLIVLMWMGRLEIIAVLALLGPLSSLVPRRDREQQ